MQYTIFYHEDVVKKDIPKIPKNIKERVKNAIEQRLMSSPLKFGTFLRRTLYGLRKLRIGDYRIIYKIDNNKIQIIKIGHRREVYSKIYLRL